MVPPGQATLPGGGSQGDPPPVYSAGNDTVARRDSSTGIVEVYNDAATSWPTDAPCDNRTAQDE